MNEPTQKSESIENFLNSLSGDNRTDKIKSDKCISPPIGCGGDAATFRDALSEKEYRISGLCQKCQDNFFGT